MDKGSTLFLRIVIVFLGLAAVGLATLMGLEVILDEADMYTPILVGIYASIIPFLGALVQAYRILNYIDGNKAFSVLSVKALGRIKVYGLAISGLYAAGSPYVYTVADREDAPGLLAMALVIVGASFVVAIAAAVLQKLFRHAVDIKSENDLTV